MSDGVFNVEVTTDEDVPVFLLRGELDVANAEEVRQALTAASGSVVVDLSELSFIDSSGLTALIHARDDVCARGGRFVMRGANGSVRRVFEITGLTHFLA